MREETELCKGSCGELVPKSIADHGGSYTESVRTVIHHPDTICHHISNLPCKLCQVAYTHQENKDV